MKWLFMMAKSGLFRIFRLLSSSLVLYSQRFSRYVLLLSSCVSCLTQEPTRKTWFEVPCPFTKRIDKRTAGLENKSGEWRPFKRGIFKLGSNSKKNSGDLRRLAVTHIAVEELSAHSGMKKTLQWVNYYYYYYYY